MESCVCAVASCVVSPLSRVGGQGGEHERVVHELLPSDTQVIFEDSPLSFASQRQIFHKNEGTPRMRGSSHGAPPKVASVYVPRICGCFLLRTKKEMFTNEMCSGHSKVGGARNPCGDPTDTLQDPAITQKHPKEFHCAAFYLEEMQYGPGFLNAPVLFPFIFSGS